MSVPVKIALFLLFIALHLNGLFVESHAFFYVSSVIVVCLAVLQKTNKNKAGVSFVGTILVSALCVFLLLQLLIRGNVYGIYRVYIILLCWLLYFAFGIFFSAGRHTGKWSFHAIAASVMVELLLGFGQLFGWIPNHDAHFRLGGAFGNPGAYAGYLAVVSPMMLASLLVYRRCRKAENIYYLLAACFIFIIFMLIVSRSRGAWLACGLGCAMALNDRFSLFRKAFSVLHTPARRVIVFALLLAAVSAGAYGLYQFKPHSALGRVLIWKVSASAPRSGLLWGNGVGYFEANYGKWQSAYFAETGGTEAECYVADYVTCAYNEFLEMAMEQGVVFLAVFAGLFVSAFRRQKNRPKSSLTSGARASLAAMFVLMCVSYPLKIAPVYLYLVFCLALLSVNTIKRVTYGLPVKLVLTGVSFVVVVAGLVNLYGYHQLGQGQKYVFAGQIVQPQQLYPAGQQLSKNEPLERSGGRV